MNIEDVPFAVTDWSQVSAIEHPGASGLATWRTVETGNLRVRMVEYSPGYVADHWCRRGHIVLVLEVADGRELVLKAGLNYQVASEGEAHRSRAPKGTKLFIVD